MVKNVEFFDWKLDQINPITSTFINYGKLYVSRMPDMHSALHIGIVLEGINCCRLGKDELSFPAGTFYLTAPWETHSTGAGDGARLLLITLDNRRSVQSPVGIWQEQNVLLRVILLLLHSVFPKQKQRHCKADFPQPALTRQYSLPIQP